MNSASNSIIMAPDHEGLTQQPWWVEQWMELINSYRFKKRLERAWRLLASVVVQTTALALAVHGHVRPPFEQVARQHILPIGT